MARAEIQRWGDDQIRVRPWRGDPSTAYVSPVPGRRPLSVGSVERTLVLLASRGVLRVFTAAVPPAEEAVMIEAGLVPRERLHLLRHDLTDLDRRDRRSDPRLRRSRPGDRRQILNTDTQAFDTFWALDDADLDEAINATPTSRVRVVARPDVHGFAVSGRAGRVGYLQRLAVSPEMEGRGFGRALILDGLRWMRRWGARHALVNTQVVNERAHSLYLHLGFVAEPHGLTVLEADLEARS
ncbi:MAG: GNAT family N-acetyltransferase [Actinomycetia bacterium]|nr:GNAT family N-acetyltransferase [Actinomycetes bacterium]MCP4962837.1 GNAT family N-acetyltransferase [Actinomycetes bacterium]